MDTAEKKDFDLELVLQGFAYCRHGDDNILSLEPYLEAFEELCRFFYLAGTVFGFVAKDIESKISILRNHQRSSRGDHYMTIQDMIHYEVGLVKTRAPQQHLPANGSRTLLRLHRALEFILEFMRGIITSSDNASSAYIASNTYNHTLAQYHPWFVRKLAGLAVMTLPTKVKLMEVMCKQNPQEVTSLVSLVLEASQPVYDVTQSLYVEHKLLDLP